jgi:hypothetical protein
MAQTQVKPKLSGSFTNYTGKATTGVATLDNPHKQMAQYAANLFAFTQGVAGARTTAATKHADAAGISLQWA